MMASFNLPGYNSTYQGAWQGSRDAQQQQIQAVLAQQAQAQAQQQAAIQAAQNRYAMAKQNTIAGLHGANRANLQDIADKYTAQSGQMAQQLINRGLGNTTVQASVQRGLIADQSKEATRSKNEFAQTIAGYRSGMAGTMAQLGMQGAGMNYGAAMAPANFLAGINIGYPDRSQYGSSFSGSASGGGGYIDPSRPTGGPMPAGFFDPGAGAAAVGGGAGGYGLADMYTPSMTSYAAPSYNYSSGAGIGYSGEYNPSYATSGRDAFAPAAGANYGAAQATGYTGGYAPTDYSAALAQGLASNGYTGSE